MTSTLWGSVIGGQGGVSNITTGSANSTTYLATTASLELR